MNRESSNCALLFRLLKIQHRNFASRKAAVDQILRENERTLHISDERQAIAKLQVCQLAANRPVEDFYSASKCLASNAFLLGVFDGHAGGACARHVSTRLYDYLCSSVLEKHRVVDIPAIEQLQWLVGNADRNLPQDAEQMHQNNIREYYRRFKKDASSLTTVRSSIQSAFISLDEAINNQAMPNSQGRVDRMAVNVAASGSCALVAHIRKNNLHVASCGDSTAVLGVELPNGLIARQLTRPHTAENVDEINRIRSAHPSSENRSILRGDRLLGELYPLRAFGDARFKWPQELQKIVLEPLGMRAPQHLFTPPYLTCLPEVFYHQLTVNDRFLVLATDGLWEFLDPDTVIRLVHDHTLGTQTVNAFNPEPRQSLEEILENLEYRQSSDSKKPLDENCATHLVRNALGGVSGGLELQYARLEETLMLPPGIARQYRDDITVVVIHFNEQFLQDAGDFD